MPTPAQAVPANPKPNVFIQPDGSTITIRQHGDEWCHWTTDLDGHLLVMDDEGFYHIATPVEQAIWESEKAQKLQKRAEMNLRRHMQLRKLRAELADTGTPVDSVATDSVPADTIVYLPDSLVTDGELSNHFLFPSRGKVHGLIVLVEFQDVRFSIDHPLQEYTDMLTKEGYDHAAFEGSNYKHIGSAHDYFYQNSFGQFDPQFDVFGPILLKDSLKHYGSSNDRYAWQMITEACDQLEDSLNIDFSAYDNNDDGIIDFVFAFYAGQGENYTSKAVDIWPHAWDIVTASGGQRFYYDSLLVYNYACTNELTGKYMDGVGTFCHEFTHVLGLPDLYYTGSSGTSYPTPNEYDLLDLGCYNRNAYVPAGMSAYERYELGWLTPTVLSEQKTDTLLYLGNANQAYIVPVTDGLDDPRLGEYYLFENRQQTRWDEYIPGHGMLVWHIDFSSAIWAANTPNNWSYHQCIDLVEADGKKKRGIYYIQDDTTPFPGSAEHTSFTDDTTPAFCGWTKPGNSSPSLTIRLDKPIANIQELPYLDEDGVQLGPDIITFDFRTQPQGIQVITTDATPQTTGSRRLVIRNGETLIETPYGDFDMMGRRK